jgi:hypothetical protein
MQADPDGELWNNSPEGFMTVQVQRRGHSAPICWEGKKVTFRLAIFTADAGSPRTCREG